MKTSAELFNHTYNKSVCDDLTKELAIRHEFPVFGRLHIDRPLPFLCIYRLPQNYDDEGTRQLLLGQASYVLIREQDADSDGFRALIKSILSIIQSLYGNALLFEIWAEDIPDYHKGESIKPLLLTLALKTTSHHAPHVMLEHMENAFLEIPSPHKNRSITLDYKDDCHPPGMSTLLTFDNPAENTLNTRCYWVGLGLSAIYRQGKEVFPYILRDLQHWLTQVLRHSFYTFTHHYTKLKPKHYHQLGRQALTDTIWEIDRELANIKNQFELLFHVTPVNSDEAWLEFKDTNFNHAPAFNYRPRPIDPDLLKRQLYNIPIENIEDPTLAFIFHSQRNEIDLQLTMINDRNSRNFLYGSLKLYGGVEPWLLETANTILDALAPDNLSKCKKSVSAKVLAQQAEQLLTQYKSKLPDMSSRVIIRDDIPGILVSKGNLMIGSNSRFLESRLAGTLAHEVGTHILTYINGSTQPFHQFYSGMANYEPLQEGLAVFSEYLVGELDAARLRRLAGRVVAVHGLVSGADFIEVFRQLYHDYHFSAYQAYYITMRVYRGGGFTKDVVYLKGFSQLLDYLGDGGDLDILYLGKLALNDVPFVEELRWRKVLNDGPLTAHYLTSDLSKKLISEIQQGISIMDLISERIV